MATKKGVKTARDLTLVILAWAMLCIVEFLVVDKVIDRLKPVEQHARPVQSYIPSFALIVKDVPRDRLVMIITNAANGYLGDVLEPMPLRRGDPMTHGVILANVDGRIYVLCKDGLYRGNPS